jgi:DNA-binding MarR family transcriptional regulator
MDTKYDLPKSLPQSVWCLNTEEWEEMVERRISYHYPFIHKTVKKMEQKELVHTSKDASGDRMKRIVKLTFQGLILYLQNSDDKQKFSKAFGHYPFFIPFAEQWDSMTRQLGAERTEKALELTVRNFQVSRVRFRLRSLGMEFEGFLESPKVLSFANEEEEVIIGEDREVREYLKTKEAEILRLAYIAYLVVHDIKKLSWESKEETEKLLAGLDSEKELAYLEERQGNPNTLFKGKRLREFLPKYAGIEYFFTGMFVNNLLWVKKKIEKVVEEPTKADFVVEYL